MKYIIPPICLFFCLYLLDFKDKAELYNEIYHATLTKTLSKSPTDPSYPLNDSRLIADRLYFVSEDERNLALWCFLKSYRKGEQGYFCIDSPTV